MSLTCILVDLENVQLRAPDLAVLKRGQHQLKIFHGPSQNKLTIEMVRALQPLGDAVEYIQCEKAGPNALDFHLAFHLGRLTATQVDVRYVIVSRDKGFAQLVAHANKLGGRVEQHASLPADIVGSAVSPVPTGSANKAPTARTPRTPRMPRAAATGSTPAAPAAAPARKAVTAKTAAKTVARKTPAKKATAAKPAATPAAAPAAAPAAKKVPARKAAAKQAPAKKSSAVKADTPPAILPPAAAPAAKPTRDIATAADRTKAIATLHKLAAKRPVTPRALLRHLQSHLGHDLSDGAVQALVDGLIAAGLITLAQGKLTYHLGA